jgi:hypothetical protein
MWSVGLFALPHLTVQLGREAVQKSAEPMSRLSIAPPPANLEWWMKFRTIPTIALTTIIYLHS